MSTKLPPQTIVKFLHRRKQLEEDLATLGKDPRVVKAVTRPNASNRGGSWKQHVTTTLDAIDKIDKLLASDGIRLPRPHAWWKAP